MGSRDLRSHRLFQHAKSTAIHCFIWLDALSSSARRSVHDMTAAVERARGLRLLHVMVLPEATRPRKADTKTDQHVHGVGVKFITLPQAMEQDRQSARNRVADISQINRQAIRFKVHSRVRLLQFSRCLMHQILVDFGTCQLIGGQYFVNRRGMASTVVDQAGTIHVQPAFQRFRCRGLMA